eukprot:7210991-Prymnesium_polylepis.1
MGASRSQSATMTVRTPLPSAACTSRRRPRIWLPDRERGNGTRFSTPLRVGRVAAISQQRHTLGIYQQPSVREHGSKRRTAVHEHSSWVRSEKVVQEMTCRVRLIARKDWIEPRDGCVEEGD